MTKKKKLSQEMIDAHNIAVAKQRIASLGLDPEDIMPKLQAKMGQYACTFVNEAMYPGYLCNRTGEPFQKSRALISTYANETISDERLAKALGAKTKKEAEAKAIKIQEAATRYKARRDWQAVIDNNATDFKLEADEKQQQAVLRITRRENTEATQSAVLKMEEKTAPQTPEKETATVSTSEPTKAEPIKEEPVAATSQKLPFTFEPVNSDPAPWLKQTTTAEATPVQTAPEQKVESRGTPMDPLRDKAREELARLKEGKEGELTLEELTNAGISDDDMSKAVTKENITEIHAGKSGIKAAKAAPKYHRGSGCAYNVRKALEAGGFKGSTYDKNEKITSGKRRGNYHNGTTQCRTLRDKDGYYTFEFESNIKGNPEIANLKEPGTYIGWEAKADSIQPLGHGAVMGPDGNWHGGLRQDAQYMSSASPAKRYKSDTYTVGFFGDCTASDKLAEDMIYQKLIREERDRQLAQNKTQETSPQTMVIAQNER